jgi:hypothetical protein
LKGSAKIWTKNQFTNFFYKSGDKVDVKKRLKTIAFALIRNRANYNGLTGMHISSTNLPLASSSLEL